MAGAKLEKTRWPGIYRRGTRWVYAWTDAAGIARRGTADTREEASRLKAEEEQRAKRGDAPATTSRRLTVAAHALDLFGADLDRDRGSAQQTGRYQGRRGAIRDSTRDDYRRDIERYWLPPLGRRPLADITTPALGRVIGDLAARDDEGYLADRTLRRLFAPIAALMATAVDEGLIPHNTARDVTLPSGRDAPRRFDPDADDDTDDPGPGKARSLTGEQLGVFYS